MKTSILLNVLPIAVLLVSGIPLAQAQGSPGAPTFFLEKELFEHTGAVTSLVWSPDGTRLLSAGADRLCVVWNPVSGQPSVFAGAQASVWGISWAPDSRHFAAAALEPRFRMDRRVFRRRS